MICYLERHEFIGDSVLDSVVVLQLFAFGAGEDGGPTLARHEMHSLRTALVNADFLAFLAMEWRSAPTPRFKVNVKRSDSEDGDANATPAAAYEETEPEPGTLFWAFLRHMSGELTPVLGQTARRHAALAGEIRRTTDEDGRYPWDLLARLRAPKVYSDVFEAVMGAVRIDSGSIDACVAVTERAGILPYLRRCVADCVKILHPKEELGRLAVSDKVVYAVKEASRKRQEDEVQSHAAADAVFECTVTVSKRIVASVSDGVTREEVKTRAAGVAVRLWEEAGGTWGGVGVHVGV